MSKQVKKPAELTPVKVSNVNLLPSGLATDPNKKMLDSTLDVMTSKGQILPFKETYGTRAASNKIEEFFKVESNQARRESQGNNMLVLRKSDDTYLGKISYYDIENYFNIKGSELKDGVVLDKNINVLDLPVDPIKLTDYSSYYWLEDDLPPCRIDLNSTKFSIVDDLLGKPFATLKDDSTGRELELQNGMVVYFTGVIDTAYKTFNEVSAGSFVKGKSYTIKRKGNTDWTAIGASTNDIEDEDELGFTATGPGSGTGIAIDQEIKAYYVYGVGKSIGLFLKSNVEIRTPVSGLEKRPWDQYGNTFDYPKSSWDDGEWDGSNMTTEYVEYIVQEKYTSNTNHWQALDCWHHISTIRHVAKFLNIKVEDFINIANKAKRPIISFNKDVKLFNWPTGAIFEINSILPGTKSKWENKTNLVDQFKYTLKDGDTVVFDSSDGLWRINNISTGATFSLLTLEIRNGDGAIIVSPGISEYYQAIYKNNTWQLAQNKTTANQTPLFEFYDSDKNNIEAFNDTSFKGGIILGFQEGATYDSILRKYIHVDSIELESNIIQVAPNQITFVTDVDSEFTYTDDITNDISTIKGPYGYKSVNKILPFYKNRTGLDFTKQLQDLLYEKTEDSAWSAEISPVTNGFTTIHIYYDEIDQYKFYFDVEGYGLIRFSGKTGDDDVEQVLPLISGGIMKIVCHDLPYPITFYKATLLNNITKRQTLAPEYISNNGIRNGTITLDLRESVTTVSGITRANELSAEDTKLLWEFNGTYKTAYVKSLYNWNFLQSVFTKDKTNPLYNNFDYTLGDIILDDGSIGYNKQLTASTGIFNKIQTGDKICVNSIIKNPESKTAPASLVVNPLNESLNKINYYSLYQHASSLLSNSTDIKKFIDIEESIPTMFMGGGTFLKHSDPLAKTAIVATNLPYDLGDILIKQGKHYDIFLSKLTAELENIINSTNYNLLSSCEVLNLALNRIYIIGASDDLFWSHSNMIGWGSSNNYYQRTLSLSNLKVNLEANEFENISHRTGKESILHISADDKILTRNVDYRLISEDGYYTAIEFNETTAGNFVIGKSYTITSVGTTNFVSIGAASNTVGVIFTATGVGSGSGKAVISTVTIKQWFTTFRSMVPASLAKIGLSPVYQPALHFDTTVNGYFLHRHDGTRYYLKQGLDARGNPINLVEYYLYEYEKAVWSSIAYDVENNNQREILEAQPGYFRNTSNTWGKSKQTINNELRQWMLENNIFIMENDSYIATNGFTLKYQLGTGDGDYLVGSYKAVYTYMYDTDRPHSHPWEMLGYTIKPTWWDTYYSWTNPAKRIALKKALRIGKISNPAEDDVVNPAFARNIDINYADPDTLEDFPVTSSGSLISPLDFNELLLAKLIYLSLDTFEETENWAAGDMGPYEQVFLNTQRGVAAQTRARFLLSPAQYVNLNWVPGQTITNAWGNKLDRTTKFWQHSTIEHNYHREVIDGSLIYTGGIESLYAEFCVLNNKDYVTEVIDKFSNIIVNKEFLLSGFTNKDNLRIQSTSMSTQKNILFVPEENYQVRTVRHYPEREIFYSGMRIIFDGTNYSLNGFATEFGFFPCYTPRLGSSTSAVTIGNVTLKEKNNYSNNIKFIQYGSLFSSRQEIYDILIGYGKYLEATGIVYEEPEGADIRNWQLSAKQFIFWSNDLLASGNYIDLNPCADFIKITGQYGQLENLEGTNENIGQCVDRFNRPLFSKDLLVTRDVDNILIKTKKSGSGIYGIKLVFVIYESVVHLDSTSIFGDVYFSASQNTTKRSFITGGKKSINWTGAYYVPGYVFDGTSLIPNFDSMAEVGHTLLDIESTVLDTEMLDASRAQFGLNRNIELRQLFLDQGNEILFKNAITFNKGTVKVFDSLTPLTHQDGSKTVAYEEYMVRLGEFGNTENIEYYEFEMLSDDVADDIKIIKFTENKGTDDQVLYVTDDSERWVYKPRDKSLNFADKASHGTLKRGGPIISGDTDLSVDTLDDLSNLYNEFIDLWSIPEYSSKSTYKINEQVRYEGKLYVTTGTVLQNQMIATANDFVVGDSYKILTLGTTNWNTVAGTTNKEYAVGNVVKVVPISTNNNRHTGTGTAQNIKYSLVPKEPYLPNIFVNNYNKPNPASSFSGFTPGTWQVLQTVDRNLAITEVCTGLTDVSKARISTGATNHKLSVGDYVCIVNAELDGSSANGIWEVVQIEEATVKGVTEYFFYIRTRILKTIYTGKVFTFKTVRFKNNQDFDVIKTDVNYKQDASYNWQEKYETEYPLTPSGYDLRYPIAIVDSGLNEIDPVTFNYGNYKVYQFKNNTWNEVKAETELLKLDDIEHLIVYDYATNKTVAKLEMFSPQDLVIPEVFKNDIDIIGRVDPAKYNRTTDKFKSIYTSLGWYEEYIGRRWWNINSTQFNDYTTASDQVKAEYWGTTTSKNKPEVYEWTKSPVHPSKWEKLVTGKNQVFGQLATGQAYVDNALGTDNYHWVEEEDYVNGKTYTVYYFWVKNKKSIALESKFSRVYTVEQLSNVLLNPSAAGLAWWSPVGTDSIIVKGIKTYLNSSSTVIQIKKKTQGEEKHQQWAFISEGNTVETIPEWLHVRLRDSISGHLYYKKDVNRKTYYIEKNVPDTINLHRYNRLGNEVRPYLQTWFSDLYEARRTFIKRLNNIMLHIDISEIANWDDSILMSIAYKVADHVIDVTNFWTIADYRSEDYKSTKSIDKIINDISELYNETYTTGEYIRINEIYNPKKYAIYEKTESGGFNVVFRKDSAIQFIEDFNLYGWDSSPWDDLVWDYDVNSAYNAIVDSIRKEIFIGKYAKYYSSIMCSMFRYVLSEQINVDWLAKSSTIEPVNLIAQTLSNNDYIKRDEISTISDFYSTVKAYRDKIRGGTINKVTIDQLDVTISETKEFLDITDPDEIAINLTKIVLPVKISVDLS